MLNLLDDAEAQKLLGLLADPKLRQQLQQAVASGPPDPTVPPRSTPIQHYVELWLKQVRLHAVRLTTLVPALPAELAPAATRLADEFAAGSDLGANLALFVAGCLGASLAGLRIAAHRLSGSDAPPGTVAERIATIARHLGIRTAVWTILVAGILGWYLLIDWPPVLGALVLCGIFAVALAGLLLALAQSAFAPQNDALRVIPVSRAAAAYWHRWTVALGTVGAVIWQATDWLDQLDLPDAVEELVARSAALLLVGLTLWAIWRGRCVLASATPGSVGRPSSLLPVAATIYLPLVWLLLMAGSPRTAWLLMVLAALPGSIIVSRRAVAHLLRAPMVDGEPASPSASAIVAERVARTVLIIVGTLILVRAWNVDVEALAAEDTLTARLISGAVDAAIILLLADLAWKLVRFAIDRALRLTGPVDLMDPSSSAAELARRQRVHTLLPILRNVLLVLLLVTAALTTLSAIGIQIGPLLAGAGVIGVALGFGAQTLVRDIISGIFFLLDDAFRVGDYIESGMLRGTVEAFSLRSIKLRHHRGPLHTVPFGDLKAVTNYSRDWMIDKIQFGLTYDTDLDKVKRIVKQISAEIMADPELAAGIIEPLKSQGLYRFAESSVQVRLKVKTKPAQQFIVRRAIQERVKKVFDANGIRFAVPMVTIAGGPRDAAANVAAAQQAVALRHAAVEPGKAAGHA